MYSLHAQWAQNIQGTISSHRYKRLLHIRQRKISADELYTIPGDLTPMCTFTPETSLKAIAVEIDKRSSSQVEKDNPNADKWKVTKEHIQIAQSRLIEPIIPDIEWREYEIIVNDIVQKISTTKEYLLKKFADVFQGVGKMTRATIPY